MHFRTLVGATLAVLSVGAHAEITEKKADTFFWELIEDFRNENPDYIERFAKNAAIEYVLPASYEIKSGKLTRDEYKDAQDELWSYTENHSFDLEKPTITVKGDKATITTTFYERYTIEGYTLTNESKQKYVLAERDNKIKIVAFDSNVKDITETEYEEKKTEAKK